MSNVSMKFGLSSGMRGLLNRAEKSVVYALHRASSDAISAVTNYVNVYPPERPDQTYARTFTFANSWWTNVEFPNHGTGNQSIELTIGNDATSPGGRGYAVYVVGPWSGPLQQATIHRRRWPTISGLKREVSPLVQSIFRDAIFQEMRKMVGYDSKASLLSKGFSKEQTRPDYWWDKEADEGINQRSMRQKIEARHLKRQLTSGKRMGGRAKMESRQKKLENYLASDPNRRERHLSEAQKANVEIRKRESQMTYPPQNPRPSASVGKILKSVLSSRQSIRGGDEAYTAKTRAAYDKAKGKK